MEQRCRRHDLSRLAVAALGYIEFDPRLLNRMTPVFCQSLNRRDAFAFDRFKGKDAGACRHAVHVNRAGAAEGHSTAVLRTRERQVVTEDPKEGGVGVRVDGLRRPIDRQGNHVPNAPFLCFGRLRGSYGRARGDAS